MLRKLYWRYRQLLPATVFLICCISTIATAIRGTVVLAGITYNFALSPKHYAGITATILTISVFFSLRVYYKYVLGLTFLLGFFDFIQFSPIQFNTGLTFGDVHIGINLVCLLAGVIIYALNHPRINRILTSPFKYDQERLRLLHQEEIEKYKEQFLRKSSEDLTQIVSSNKLVPAALTAANQLLQERQIIKLACP